MLDDAVEPTAHFARAVHLATAGRRRLLIRAADAAGNSVESTLELFIDVEPPAVSGFIGVPGGSTSDAVAAVKIILSEPPAAGTFDLDDITLFRDGAPVPLGRRGAVLTAVSDTAYELSGLAAFTGENGQYELRVSMSGVRDVAGNSGVADGVAAWEKRDANDAPAITITTARWEYDEGETITIQGFVTDDAGPWTGTVDIGCGCGAEPLTFTGPTGADFILTTPVPDGRNEVYHGTVSITDEQGETTSESFVLTVHNLPPDIQYFRSVYDKVLTGETVSFSAYAADPANSATAVNDPLTYTFEFGDGSDPVVVTDPGGGRGHGDAEATATHAFAAPGTYAVTLTVTDDEGASDSAVVEITVTAGDAVGDRVWEDTNGNGLQDDGEPGIAGVTVELYDPDGTLLDSTLTDADGRYRFAGVTGPCFLEFDAGAEYLPAPVDAGTDDAADSDADSATGRTPVFTPAAGYDDRWDAGFFRPGEIRGLVWQDDDADGFHDPAESARADCTVYIDLDGSGDFSPGDPSAVAGIDGTYHFTNLAPGVYRVARVPAKGWVQTRPAAAGATNRLVFRREGALETGRAEEVRGESYSVPVYSDWNDDGVFDLLIGEKTGNQGKLRVYLNRGTNAAPAFSTYTYARFATGDDLVVPASGCLGLAPRTVDWDADGRPDLLAGLADGRIMLFLNVNTSQEPRFDAGTFVQIGEAGAETDLDVGDRAVFDITDWNDDGMFDLLVGGKDGRVRIALNEGTPGAPVFRTLAAVQEEDHALVAAAGRAAPATADLDGDGCKDLVVGDTDGNLFVYLNRGPDDAPRFTEGRLLRTATGTPSPASQRARPSLADFNGDGLIDILVGGSDGKVRAWTRVNDVVPGMYTVHLDSGTVADGIDFGESWQPTQSLAVHDDVQVDANSSDTLLDLLANDYSHTGQPLRITAVSQAAYGTVALVNGSVYYTPPPDFTGPDTFTYTIQDSASATDTGTVAVEVADIDTDRDGLGDVWETRFFGDLSQGPDGDYDGDGETNLTEWTNGTDPADARSTGDPAHAYEAFQFEIFRSADQTADRGFAERGLGVQLACILPEGWEFASGTLTKPDGTAGEAVASLTAGSGAPGEARYETSAFSDFSTLAADFVPGVYRVHIEMSSARRRSRDLRFKIVVAAYSAGDFPAYVGIVAPPPNAVHVSTVPLFRFSASTWDWLEVRTRPAAAQVYFHPNVGQASKHRVPPDRALALGADYTLTVDVNDAGNTWLGSRTRIEFATVPAGVAPCPWDDPVEPQAGVAAVFLRIVRSDAREIADSDFVGVFSSGELRTAQPASIQNGDVFVALSIPVAADGETLAFRLWDSRTGTELQGRETLSVAPGASVGGPGDPFEVVFGLTRFSLTLTPGWNLISLPIDPLDPRVEQVLGTGQGRNEGILGPVWRWNNREKKYEAAVELHALRGYWVYAKSAETFSIPGMLAVPSRDIRDGWNLVGPPARVLRPAHAFLQGYFWHWDAGHGRFMAVPENGNLAPGRGYWLYASEPFILEFDAR